MLRRLLIAVFVIGLIAAFSGTAFADENPQIERKPFIRSGQDVSGKALLPTHQTQPADFQRSTDDAQGPVYEALNGSPAASPTSPDTVTACPYEQDYTDYAGTSFFFTWTRPGGDTRELAMRFDVQGGHTAEVYGSWYYLFLADAGAEVQAIVYGDADGIIPDDTDTIFVATSGPLAEDTVGGYYYMDFAAQNGGYPVIVDGYTNFHIGYSSVAAGGERVRFGSDDGGDPTYGGTATGTLRSSYRAGGVWLPTLPMVSIRTSFSRQSCASTTPSATLKHPGEALYGCRPLPTTSGVMDRRSMDTASALSLKAPKR